MEPADRTDVDIISDLRAWGIAPRISGYEKRIPLYVRASIKNPGTTSGAKDRCRVGFGCYPTARL